LTALVGTPGYIDPYILTLRKYRNEAVISEHCESLTFEDILKTDLFGLGMTLYYLFSEG
jgi:hypothetical protein